MPEADRSTFAPAPARLEPHEGAVYEIPVEGSLGLLALGARGVQAWRQKRASVSSVWAPKAPVPHEKEAGA